MKKGVDFVSLTDSIDTTTAAGRFFFHVMASLAQMEQELVSERTKAGLEVARMRGRVGGRPRKMTDGKLELVRKLIADSAAPPREIAETLGISLSTLYRWIPAEMHLDIFQKGFNTTDIRTKNYQEPSLTTTNLMRVHLWLRVENNNKFVRGKKKARQEIERFHLSHYDRKKLYKDGWEYELTISYKDDEELDRNIYDLLAECDSCADSRYCFIEIDVRAVEGPERSW